MAGSFRSPSKVVRRMKLTPLVSRNLKSWPRFMYHYSLGLVPESAYQFRNGAQIRIGRGVDHVPIIEIFLRQDYGQIPDDSVILDLGASIGVFSIYAASTARNVRLFAYEPMPDFFALMKENIALNRLEGVVSCFNLAVAGEAQERELFASGTDFFFPTLIPPANDDPSTRKQVTCTTLTNILDSNDLEAIDIVKMDIEGAEYEILYATPPNYFKRIREIRMEYHNLDYERNVTRLKQFLTSHNYAITHERANSPTNGNLWARR
jgi:FkbM family methyltransferase